MIKDNFSQQANQYVKFRPVYPQELYDWLLSLVKEKNKAWDCGTGNGQVAGELAKYFIKVEATDISAAQLTHAIQKENIHYQVEGAEHTSFPDQSFDLITVAQAIHWFNFEKFYKEVRRTLKPEGVLAVIGYGLANIDSAVDPTLHQFYYQEVGPYWDKERKFIDEEYQTIPFPFKELQVPELYIEQQWTLNHFLGYLETWSAVQHYIKERQQNPVDTIKEHLATIWKEDEIKTVRFPLLLRAGKV